MKKGLLIGGLSFVAGVLTSAYGLVGLEEKKDNKVLFEDEKIKMTEIIRHKDNSRLAYIQMKDEKKA